MSLYRVLVAALLVTVTYWAEISADCVYKGVSYKQGPIVTSNPCDHCICTERGTAACAIVDCFYPMVANYCPDGTLPVHKEGFCCPVCNDETTTLPQFLRKR
ncbi:hypothetical protein BsWGS_12008 [Bradybaena similaris]